MASDAESTSNGRVSNRESAKRLRTNKQERVRELIREEALLKEENEKLRQRIEAVTRKHFVRECYNNVLRARMAELADRLKWLNSLLQDISKVTGLAIEIPGELLQPGSVCP
ncbi:bZIP transcription factor 53-like [Salvia splendens]|nr:bZIP transcription factor 53-like [Salvia splendens]